MTLRPCWAVRLLGLDELDPERYVTSYVLDPRKHTVVRGVMFAYAATVLVAAFVQTCMIGTVRFFPFYYTHLSYSALTVYLGTMTWHTWRYARHGRECGEVMTLARGSWRARFIGLLYPTVAAAHTIVPVIYWAFLFQLKHQKTPMMLWTNVSEHGGDLGLLLVEVGLNRARFRWRDILIGMGSMLVYMPWMWLSRVIYGKWIYPFLALGPGSGPWIAYIGTLCLIAVLLTVMRGVHVAREWLGVWGGRWERMEEAQMGQGTLPKGSGV